MYIFLICNVYKGKLCLHYMTNTKREIFLSQRRKDFQNKVKMKTKDFWLPKEKTITKKKETNAWFDLKQTYWKGRKQEPKLTKQKEDKILKEYIKAEKIILRPTTEQKTILLNWLKSYTKMYNQTLLFIKQKQFANEETKDLFNWQNLRTNHLKEQRANIQKESISKKDPKTKIPIHSLDGAIQDICSAFKSAFSNLKGANIKKFRMRFLKQTKKTKVMKIENQNIAKKGNTFCKTALGKKIISSKNLLGISSDCRLHYDQNTKRFTLLVPKKFLGTTSDKKKLVCLDPGLRTFLVGFTSTDSIELGTNLISTLKVPLTKIERLEKSTLRKNLKEKAKNKRFSKIKNLVDDLHWKTINYLTKTYKTVVLGKLSTKSIVQGSTLSGLLKNIALKMGFFKFMSRLSYKAQSRGVKVIFTEESLTSKTCTSCGNINDDLGKAKLFSCPSCFYKIDRDLNGARNILIKVL